MNTDVCGCDRNKPYNIGVDCIISPLGGETELFIIESFIQEICSKTLNNPVMKQVKYLLNHSFKLFIIKIAVLNTF